MDVILALQALRELLIGAAEFSSVAAQAHSEGRKLTSEEVAKFRDGANLALDDLDAKIKAAGG